jgi:ABC-type transporter Mla subunit MlaD
MEYQSLIYVMTAFVVIAGVSLLVQLGFIFGIYRAAKATQERVAQLTPKVEAMLPKVNALVDNSQKTVEQSKQQILEITAKANDILDSAKKQLVTVDGVLTDAAARARTQMDRAEMILDDTMSRAHETVATVHHGIMRPLREVQAVAAGVKAAVSHLARGDRPNVSEATHDEEMFI